MGENSLKFILNSKQAVNDVINRLLNVDISENKPLLEVTVTKYKANRSLSQNKLLHMWFAQIAKDVYESGGKPYTPEVWKYYLKQMFLGEDVIELPDGKMKIEVKGTSKLNTKEMTDFLENIDHFCGSELNVQLHHPGDYQLAMGIKND